MPSLRRLTLALTLVLLATLPAGAADLDPPTGIVAQDVVQPDDVIVQGSQCVGFDCTDGMAFGFDTLVLKENNLQIFFDDTSNSSSFPARDWRIKINDSANGGAEYFAIQDATAGLIPFRIVGNAPENSLYVDSDGRVGLGTASPTKRLQVEGDALVKGTLEIGSSRSLKKDIRPLPADQALAALTALVPVTYAYKANPSETCAGFIAEDVPDLLATNGRASLSPMDFVAVLTSVVQAQQQTIASQRAELKSLADRVAALEQAASMPRQVMASSR